MFYLRYHELLKEYKKIDREFNNALDKYSDLLKLVQIKASQYQEVLVNNTNVSSDNKLIIYLSEIDEVLKLIDESKKLKFEIKDELKEIEHEMRNGYDIYDKIYVYKWIDKMSPYKFSRLIGYSVRQIYNLIKEMKVNMYGNKQNKL